jgi:sporulation protein YqfC
MSEVQGMSRKANGKRQSRFTIPTMISNEAKIEMLGNREIIIDGCKGIVEYEENLIKLSLGETVLSLSGVGLVITSFDSGIAVINGQIGEISFVS